MRTTRIPTQVTLLPYLPAICIACYILTSLQWCNRDLIPIPEDRRTWDWQGFAGYWIITGANNSAWTAGSTLLALGLSVGQAMGVIVGSSLIISVIAVVAGWMGSHDYLGFTVMSRA